jgi:adenylate cyclase
VIALLNDYFDIVTTQVEKHHGQVLKFTGDGLLAVFDVGGSNRGTACCQAVHAAIDAVRAMAASNRDREEPLALGIALHLDDVLYGNIGAVGRLDFTVIGRAVNEAARIEQLCRSLDRQVLASASFARSCGCEPLVSLGPHCLRGVGEPQEIFALAEARLAG